MGTSCFVLEAALLLEDHYDEICHELWYIYTEESVRRIRLKESRGYSDEKNISDDSLADAGKCVPTEVSGCDQQQ